MIGSIAKNSKIKDQHNKKISPYNSEELDNWDSSNEQYKRLQKLCDRLVRKNNLVQLQILGAFGKIPKMKSPVGGNLVGFFNDSDELYKAYKSIIQSIKYTDIFVNLNKVSTKFLCSVELNKLVQVNDKVCFLKEKDIRFYKHLYIDIDSTEKNKPVSLDSMDRCITLRDKVAKYLIGEGFPEPIQGRSGNGAYLLFALKKFENKDTIKQAVKDVIAILSKRFSTEYAKIDTKVVDPVRNIRMPTSLNTKTEGDSVIKNRRALIEEYPEQLRAYDFSDFEKFYLLLTSEKNDTDTNNQQRKINIPKFLAHYKIKTMGEKVQDGYTLHRLDKCIFDPSHSPNEASIGQQLKSGKLFYQCFHDSCSGKTWHDAREKISGTDKLTDFIDGGLSAFSSKNQYADITVVGMDEVMEYKYKSQPFIKDLLDEEEATLVIGSSGVGKSLLTLYISLLGATPPKPTLGLNAVEVMRPFSTLFVQSENTLAHTSSRLKQIIRIYPDLGNGMNKISLLGRDGDCRVTGQLSDSKFQAKVIDGLVESNADVMIMDPLISFHNVNENDNSEIRKELDCLKRICDIASVSVILVHHAGKGQTAENKGGRGASAIADWADRIIFLERETKNGNDYLKVTCQKTRNTAAFKPYYIDITDMKFQLVSHLSDEKIDVVVKALAELGGVAKNQEELAAKVQTLTSGSTSTAKRHIKKAVDAGLIDVTDVGRAKGYKSLEVVEED